MTKLILQLSILFISTSCFSQYYNSEVYWVKGKSHNNIGPKYVITQLILQSDSSFHLYNIYYSTKKEMRKNIFVEIDIIKGNWHVSSDTLTLIPLKARQTNPLKEMKFIRERNVIYSFEMIEHLIRKEYKKYGWHKVR